MLKEVRNLVYLLNFWVWCGAMLKKIKNIFCLVSILIFITLTASFYFSDQNIRATNKSRSFYAVKLLHDALKLPLLTNDTKGIIEYRNDVQEFIDKRKKWVWEGLIRKGLIRKGLIIN